MLAERSSPRLFIEVSREDVTALRRPPRTSAFLTDPAYRQAPAVDPEFPSARIALERLGSAPR